MDGPVKASEARSPSVLRIPARELPTPAHLSPSAQAALEMRLPETTDYPALGDLGAWRTLAAMGDEAVLNLVSERAARVQADVQDDDVDRVRVFVATPRGVSSSDERV